MKPKKLNLLDQHAYTNLAEHEARVKTKARYALAVPRLLGSQGLEEVLQTAHFAALGLPAPVELSVAEVQDKYGLVSRTVWLHDHKIMSPQIPMDNAATVDLFQDGTGCRQQLSIPCKVAKVVARLGSEFPIT